MATSWWAQSPKSQKQKHGAPHFSWVPSLSSRGFATLSSLKTSDTGNDIFGAIDEDSVLLDVDAPSISPMRRSLIEFFQLKTVEMIICSAIALNLCFIIVETDYAAKEEDSPKWVAFANSILILFYTIELCLRLFAFRLAFFHKSSNVLDMVVVLTDFVFFVLGLFAYTGLPHLSILRTLRMFRLARTLKVLIMFPELTRMVNSLIAACKKVFWAGLLLVLSLMIWSLLAVQLIHPLNKRIAESGYYAGCSRCPDAYGSVFQPCLTILQVLIAGDSWGSVTLAVMEEYPITVIFFVAMLLNIGLIMLNLITAMIVDGAQDAREQEDCTMARLKEREYVEASEKLRRLCESIDTDKSGTLTCADLRKAFDDNEEFWVTMRSLDIGHEDIDVLFNILDLDKSGDVDYAEFVDQMHRMRCDDMHTLVVFIKYYVTQAHFKVSEQLRLLRTDVCQQLLTGGGHHFAPFALNPKIDKPNSQKQSTNASDDIHVSDSGITCVSHGSDNVNLGLKFCLSEPITKSA